MPIFLFVAATLAWSALAGKDLNFDQLSYHFYLAFNFLEQRLAHDFMAANGQSYLNPLPYVPFYWMVKSEWPSLLIASVLAAIHSLNIVLAYLIGWEALEGERRHRRAAAILGAVLAFLSPIFLLEVGTSFADVTTSVLVLASVLCVLRFASTWDRARLPILFAGAFLGAAAGLKLSNAIFAPALLVMLACMHPLKRLPAIMALLGAGGAAGLLIVHGYWGWQLWREFGNPFFPMFSSLFPSDDYPVLSGANERFLPSAPIDYLLLPLRMLQLRAWIYIESVAPDLRFGALLLSLAALTAMLAKRFLSREQSALPTRKTVALTVFMVAAYTLWLSTSGNGRYGMVVSLLCGPVCVVIMSAVFRRTPWVLWAAGGLAALQLIHLQHGQLRWIEGRWTPSWYELQIPERLKTEEYLYVSVGGNANSYLFPFLARGSAYTNPIGQLSIELDGPGGRRLRDLFAQYAGRIRVIALIPNTDPQQAAAAWHMNVGALVARLGYAIATDDCETISAAGAAYEVGQDSDDAESDVRHFQTCRLVPREFELAHERARVKSVVDEIVEWCPKLFKPDYSVVEHQPNGWFVNYSSTDITLAIRGEQIFATQARARADIYLGTLTDWQSGRRPDCAKIPAKPRFAYTF